LPNLYDLQLYSNQLSGRIPNFTAFLASLDYVYFHHNCGLIAYDAAQESVLNNKDPDWQKQNPNCPASTVTDCNTVTEIPVSECQALMELYNSTNGPNWKNHTGWNQTNTPCSWYGVICSGAGHVDAIELSTADDFSNPDNIGNGNGLTGKIPDLNLPNLTDLSLAGNQLSGNIPNFSNLPKLTILYLWSNQLSGNIPNFSNLPKLGHLYLWSNQLSGSIPNFNLPNLVYLRLDDNQLSGSIPNFSDLPSLVILGLNDNQLSGNIPSFDNLISLEGVDLSSNQLSGLIPNNLTNLEYVEFNNNCGLTAHDTTQESVLDSKDPAWQIRNPNCPAYTATLTITKMGNGSVTSVPAGIDCGASCTANYSANTAVTLTAIADTGYGFSSWSDDCSGTDNVTTVTMDMDKNCTATFSGSNQPPVASFTATPNSGFTPLKVVLDYSTSYDPDGTIVNYDWQVNGQPISVETAEQQKFITFNAAGTYSVNLTVTDNDGLTHQTQQIVTVNSQNVGMQTLILTNYRKLVELYGTSDADKLMTNLNSLASHSAVQGEVIHVEDDPAVAAAYNSRGSRYDDKNRANAVAEAIKKVILNRWDNFSGALQYLVFAGDDRVIPFYRIIDGTSYPDPMTLTDDFYLDHPPYNPCTNCANQQLFIPDIAGGRLVESPAQIIGMIETFIAKPRIYLGSAVVVGWDFLVDGAQSHCQALQKDNISTDCTLISQTWSAQNFKQQVFDVQHDAAAINLHADYNVYQAPTYDMVFPADLLNAQTNFTGRLFYSTGCHSGQNVASDLDWPETYATKRANYVGNTGFGWGGSGVILSEKLMRHFSEELTASTVTLGMALMQTKQNYLAEAPNPGEYDEKITAESTLYGLPMYQVESPPSLRRATNRDVRRSLRANTFLAGGTEKTSLSYDWPASTPVVTAQGSFYTLDGKVTSDDNEPILPRLANDISRSDKALHGVVFRGGNYTKVNAAPALQRFTTTTGHQTPEQTFVTPGWYPSQFFTANTIKLNNGDKQTVVATAGQYNPNLSSGQQRIFNNMDFDAYYHTANDWTPPAVYITDSKLQSNLATVSVTASDAAGIAEIVIAYTDGQALWNSANLTSSGTSWSGSFAANSDTEFFVQAVDSNGNVAVNDNDGKYFKFDNLSTLPMSVSILPILDQNFTGGIAINGQPHQSTAVLNLSDTVEVTGQIAVRTTDVGKTADIFVYAEATLPPSPEVYHFMLGEGLNILVWDKNPANLATFMSATLGTTQTVPMYQGTFFYPGTLKVYFGYRLLDGTVVTSGQAIDITILP